MKEKYSTPANTGKTGIQKDHSSDSGPQYPFLPSRSSYGNADVGRSSRTGGTSNRTSTGKTWSHMPSKSEGQKGKK